MKRNIIITVAPTGSWGAGKHNPITPEAIASEVTASVQAGASVVHIHSRDHDGILSADLSSFNRAATLIRASSAVLIEASTGGLSDLTADERALPASHPKAAMGSLNIGSLNFGNEVYRNSVPDVMTWIERMRQYNAKPSLEIFDTGHLETARFLIQEGYVCTPANVSFIFNVKWGMPFDANLLRYLVSRLPDDCTWGAIFVESRDFVNHLAAVRAGARFVRCGFEDSTQYAGKTAIRNAELVSALRDTIENAGYTVADPATAREILLI